jgi:hypothetical protein
MQTLKRGKRLDGCDECQRLSAARSAALIKLTAARDDLRTAIKGDKRNNELKREIDDLRKAYWAASKREDEHQASVHPMGL